MTGTLELGDRVSSEVLQVAAFLPQDLHAGQWLPPSLVALLMLGILAWWLFWLLRRNRVRGLKVSPLRVSVAYWLTAPALLITLYVLDSRALVEDSVAPPDAMPIRVTDSGGQWKFLYPNDKLSINRLVVAQDRAVQLILTSSSGVRDFCLPGYDLRARVVVGRYATFWFKPGPPGESAMDCSSMERWFFRSRHSRAAPTGAMGVSVLATAAFDDWVNAKAETGGGP